MLPYRDGIFGAGVDDGLQQVVEFCDVQLGLHQKLLDLLLHGHSYGCRHLFLQGETAVNLHYKETALHNQMYQFGINCHDTQQHNDKSGILTTKKL